MGISGADALEEGTMVGGYRIGRLLGGGGMGTVHAAEEPTIGKRVAIKVLRRALAGDPAVAARFEREARAANDVRPPAIVDVLALGRLDDGRPYLVMSLLEGRPLREEIRARGRIPAREAWAWARKIAEALAAAHEVGIVHRDLKPDNVFLERFAGRPPRPRLLDLGLVKVTREEGDPPAKLTATGAPMGTPAYMAPEQWWGSDVDGRADQYALGVTLFEMLAGDPPFRAQQFMELAQAHTSAPPPSLADRGVSAPDAVEALVARALAKSPDDRFPSMTAFVEAGDAAFGEASADEPVPRALAAPTPARAVSAPAAPTPKAAPAPAARDDARAGRFLLIHALVGIAGASAIVAIGYAGAERRDLAEWRSGGWPVTSCLALFVAGAILTGWAGARRARTGARSSAPWAAALGTAGLGAIGTYLGWDRSVAGIAMLQAPTRFEILHRGIFEVELLLTRDAPGAIPAGAPPDASWVLGRDFVALRVEIADDGLRAGDAEPFGDVAPRLVERALASGGRVRIAAR